MPKLAYSNLGNGPQLQRRVCWPLPNLESQRWLLEVKQAHCCCGSLFWSSCFSSVIQLSWGITANERAVFAHLFRPHHYWPRKILIQLWWWPPNASMRTKGVRRGQRMQISVRPIVYSWQRRARKAAASAVVFLVTSLCWPQLAPPSVIFLWFCYYILYYLVFFFPCDEMSRKS